MKVEELFEKIKKSDRRGLSKAITLVESSKQEDRKKASKLIDLVMPFTGKSQRIGISGIPGVGKSTFIEVLGKKLIAQGKKVAVLAVDPSSPISGGSILGDKTRMEELSQSPSAFIRPSPTAGSLGGVGQKTREAIFLCEASGFDIILVETVGVGQSEFEVSSMVDLFMVLMVPNAGDELQGIKKGIIELADFIVINKTDGSSKQMALQAKSQYQNALSLLQKNDDWETQVLTCSALEEVGIDEIISSLKNFFNTLSKNNELQKRRKIQKGNWLKMLFNSSLENYIKEDPGLNRKFNEIRESVLESQKNPQEACDEMLTTLLKK